MTELSDAQFLGAPAQHASGELSDSDFLGASAAAPPAASADTTVPGGPIAKPSFGNALGYGIANAVPFAHDIGAAIQAGETYLPKALQVDDVGNIKDNSASFGQRWAQQKARIEATQAQNEQNYPVTSFVTPLATSVGALPVAGPVDAVSSGIASVAPRLGGLAADTLASGAVGAGYGAAYGAGSGDTLNDRLSNAESGAIFGGVGGATVPAIVKGVSSVGNAGAKLVKGALNPEGTGADLAADKVANAVGSGSGAMSPQDVADAQTRGQPVVLGDLGDEATRRLARTAANVSPEAKATLQDPLAARFASQNTRLNDFVDSLYGGDVDAEAMKVKLAQQAAPVNKAAYAQAEADGAARPNGVWQPDRPLFDANGDPVPSLPDLVNHPQVQQAIKNATRVAQEDAVSRGISPVRNPFVQDANGNMVLGTQPNGSQAIPGLPFWDYVQRGLRTQREQAFNQTDKDAARRIGIVRNQVLANVDDLVPSFAAARQGAFQAFGADNALDAGANILKPSITPFQVQQAVAAAKTPLQKQALDYGAASAIVNKAANASDSRDVVKLFTTPAIRDKLAAAMDPNRLQQLEAYLRTEASMNMLKNAVSGNSTTAEQAHGLGALAINALASPVAGAVEGAAIGYHEHGFDPAEMAKYGALGALGGMMRKAYSGINARMMQSVAENLASSDPGVVNAAVLRIAKNKQMMEALRRVSGHLAAAPAVARQAVTLSQPQYAQ